MTRSITGFIRIPTDELSGGLYEVKSVEERPPELVAGVLPPCPCCHKPLSSGCDYIQSGFWDDDYRTVLFCIPCATAVVYRYKLSHERLDTSRRNKARSAAQGV